MELQLSLRSDAVMFSGAFVCMYVCLSVCVYNFQRITIRPILTEWCDGAIGSASNLHRFESCLGTIVQYPWASFLHLCSSVTKQYNVVPTKAGGVNRHAARYTGPVSVASQCKLVSG